MGAFAKLVNENLEALISKSSSASDNPVQADLARLSEGAITLGAERLLAPIQAMQPKGRLQLTRCPRRAIHCLQN